MEKNKQRHIKRWLTPCEQVEHLKGKGVRFALVSEEWAVSYLSKNNNYFRLRSYRTGFSKVEEGPRKGQYANLDFKMLVDLSIIDMLLRYQMLPMTLDIEHFAKVRLLERIEEAGEDGYSIVRSFLASYDETNSKGEVFNSAKNEIRRGSSSPYVAGILAKYPDFDFPAWVFLELVSFGSFIYFYKFCADKFDDKKMMDEFYLLQSVKSFRNAVSMAVGGVSTIGKGQRKSKLSNDRLQQVATTLYVHNILASEGVHQHRSESLHAFVLRMNKHIEYYEGNDQISSGFEFIKKLVDAWFSPEIVDSEKTTLDSVCS